MNRVKVSLSLDPTLVEAVDQFVLEHAELDRSKVMDQALGLWTAARQAEAMAGQYVEGPDADEWAAWRSTRRAAAGRRLKQR